MSTLLIKNGHLIDPSNGIDEQLDIFINDGQVEKVAKSISKGADQVIDAKGKIVCPGLIDLQVHLREPGREDKETLKTGLSAAIAGGFTGVVTMPNLNPVADNQATIEFQLRKADQLKLANLYPAGAITVKQAGKQMAEMRELKLAGAIAVTDDGVDVQNSGLLKKAMEWAKTMDLLVMSHCEEEALHDHGVMHEGEWSTKMALPGVSAEVEDYGVFRSLLLAQMSGAKFHALHCSTAGGLEMIAAAKQKTSNITCETCPQYFALTDEICQNYNTMGKMYPPIRSEEHRQAVISHIKSGTIDCISTDHAPHLMSEKLRPFTEANFGSVGLETSLALSYTHLVKAGHIDLTRLVSLLSVNPAKVIGVDRGHLTVGAVADVTIFDPEKAWVVEPEKFHSKGRNCVFSGMKVYGKATDVIVGGEVKLRNAMTNVG